MIVPSWPVRQNRRVLCVVGDLVEDVVVRVHQAIRPGTDTAATIQRRAGGSAASVAREAARFGPARFIGRVGDDATGRALVADLEHDFDRVKAYLEARLAPPPPPVPVAPPKQEAEQLRLL